MEAFHTGAISTRRAMPTPCFHHRYRREVFSWPLAPRRSHQSGVEDILNPSYALDAWSRRSLPDADGDSVPLNKKNDEQNVLRLEAGRRHSAGDVSSAH